MAALKGILCKNQLLKSKITISHYIQNGMSQFPKYYIEPVYKKEELKELEKSGDIDRLAHLPTKPASSDSTCSFKQDPNINLFVNYVMKCGKKSLARELVEKSFENIKRIQLEKYHKCESEEEKNKLELNPRVIFHNAVENCKPLVELTGVRRGGVKYQVPVPVAQRRSLFLSMKWLIAAALEKDGKVRFTDQLARELVDAAHSKGKVVKKKQELHKQCEANRAYAHYRWN